jgi:hypothetical protein
VNDDVGALLFVETADILEAKEVVLRQIGNQDVIIPPGGKCLG